MLVLPYYELQSLKLPFDQKIDVFGVLSTVGVITGALLAARAARKYGPGDDTPLRDVVPWAVIIGLLGAHFMHIFAYHPELLKDAGLTMLTVLGFGAAGAVIYGVKKLSDNARWGLFIGVLVIYYLVTRDNFPDRNVDFMTTVKAWDGLASTGGVLGALLGIFIFFRREKIVLTPYLDALALGTAPGWSIARIGCFLVHDHPGVKTDFFLATNYPGGPRHDLGIYDAVALASIAAVIWLLARKPRGTGLLMGILASVYSVSRFSLDFLRASDMSFVDKRYWGLTPAQYLMVVMFFVGLNLIWKSFSAPVAKVVPPPPKAAAKTAKA